MLEILVVQPMYSVRSCSYSYLARALVLNRCTCTFTPNKNANIHISVHWRGFLVCFFNKRKWIKQIWSWNGDKPSIWIYWHLYRVIERDESIVEDIDVTLIFNMELWVFNVVVINLQYGFSYINQKRNERLENFYLRQINCLLLFNFNARIFCKNVQRHTSRSFLLSQRGLEKYHMIFDCRILLNCLKNPEFIDISVPKRDPKWII